MKILHICSYYNTSSLYKYLFDALRDNSHVMQKVYVPSYYHFRLVQEYGTVRELGKSSLRIDFVYDECLYKLERYFLLWRIKKVARRIKKEDNLKDCIMHGHSLMFNGGICYEVHKKDLTRYVVTVRSTDIEILQKLPIYKNYALKIVENAERVIFVSYSLQKKFMELFPQALEYIKNKCLVIPNGIPETWFDNLHQEKIQRDVINFVYQGTFHARKNLLYTVDLMDCLNVNGVECKFRMYGAGPEQELIEKKIKESNYSSCYSMDSWSNSIEVIKKRYSEADIFIMLSSDETFGISYIEALASGVPIVYKKGEGVDGFFEDSEVALGLECEELEEDYRKIVSFLKKTGKNKQKTYDEAKKFLWSDVALKLLEVYGEINET